MSAITNSPPFSLNSMDVVSLEAKGSKGSKGSKSGGGSKPKESRPDTKRNLEPKNKNTPGTVLPIKIGPIPPRDQHEPNVMYIDPSKSAAEMNAGKSLVRETDEVAAARQRVLSWKNPAIHDAYAAKARGSSSSGKSGPVTYDGGKCLAAGSSSDVGSKSLAVYSPGGSANNSCSIS
ncbi:MAG TPA: hypothetical protein VGZ69_01065 [Candidatus Rhabdochlamydia sp.]|jgi:hypothetical protein|nr:hypothetical protein [Candidatus Rhabdochlamydia sp.]